MSSQNKEVINLFTITWINAAATSIITTCTTNVGWYPHHMAHMAHIAHMWDVWATLFQELPEACVVVLLMLLGSL